MTSSDAGAGAGVCAGGAAGAGAGSSAHAVADVTSTSSGASLDVRMRYFFGRIESAVPWMNARSLSRSAGLSRLVKSGMPSFT